MYDQPISRDDSVGYGLAGCAGGILAGIFGGGILLLVLSMILAITATTPVPMPTEDVPDLRLNLSEPLLNRLAQAQSQAPGVHLDILPGNRVGLTADTSVSAFGVSVPVQIQGLFGLQITNQAIEVRLIDSQVSGITLPPEMTHFFEQDVAAVNQNLAEIITNLSTLMGAPLTLTGLGTTDTELWLEIRETP
jgi:hypothetical protein